MGRSELLNGLTEAVDHVDDADQVRKLVGRQLPAISARLAATLAKLQAPATDSQRMLRLSVWWEAVARRHESEGVVFRAVELDDNLPIIEALFDSAVENLIRNALRKRALDPTLVVEASLRCSSGVIELAVQDSGAPVPEDIVRQLFRSPVASRDGMGIGLYQLAEQAAESGYQVLLASNRAGCVRVILTNREPGKRQIESGAAPLGTAPVTRQCSGRSICNKGSGFTRPPFSSRKVANGQASARSSTPCRDKRADTPARVAASDFQRDTSTQLGSAAGFPSASAAQAAVLAG